MVWQSAEGNAGTIGALGVIVFVGFRFAFPAGYAGEHDDLIENVEIARPKSICGRSARIHCA